MARSVALFLTCLTVASLPIVQGCSSSYQPARSPRIVTVIDGGGPAFVKDGVNYGGPLFGGGVVDAVRGNARAEGEARTGRNLTIAGFVVDMAGLGSDIAGLATIRPNGSNADNGLSLGLVLGGVVGVAVGSALLFAGPPHTYDAINIYNDSLDAPPARPTEP
jgi:hypothetical protein